MVCIYQNIEQVVYMSLEDSKSFKREIFVREGKIVAGTDYMGSMLYTFYLYKDGELLSNPPYSKLNHKEFDVDLEIGDYSVRFFYKFNEKAIGVTEKFSIIEKSGNMVTVKEAENYFVDSYNNPVTKRISKSIVQKQEILKKESKKIGDSYPGYRFDIVIMTLPISGTLISEYLFIAIDSFSKEMYFDIYGSTSYIYVASFIENLIAECPYSIDHINIDNTLAIKGLSKLSNFCKKVGIKYDLVPMDQFINKSKSLAVIDGLIKELYREDTTFESKRELVEELITLTNKYNFFEKNIEIGDVTPYQKLERYFK